MKGAIRMNENPGQQTALCQVLYGMMIFKIM